MDSLAARLEICGPRNCVVRVRWAYTWVVSVWYKED